MGGWSGFPAVGKINSRLLRADVHVGMWDYSSLPFGFFQLPIDPKLNAPDGKQVEFGFGFARNDFVADTELPLPDARSDSRDGVFNALVNHVNNPLRPQPACNPKPLLKIVII